MYNYATIVSRYIDIHIDILYNLVKRLNQVKLLRSCQFHLR